MSIREPRRGIFPEGLIFLTLLSVGCSEVKDPNPFGYQGSICNACHGNEENPAPPGDLSGNTYIGFISVGTHQPHLAAPKFSRVQKCTECHIEVTRTEDLGHIDDSPYAEVVFGALATDSGAVSPVWIRDQATCRNVYCHGEFALGDTTNNPVWTEMGGILCGTCHRIPPPSPHPSGNECHLCHGSVIDENYKFTRVGKDSLHVNGQPDF